LTIFSGTLIVPRVSKTTLMTDSFRKKSKHQEEGKMKKEVKGGASSLKGSSSSGVAMLVKSLEVINDSTFFKVKEVVYRIRSK